MDQPSTFVGLDAHKDTIVVAMLWPGAGQAVEWRIVNEPQAVRRLARKLQRVAVGSSRCCYEAGPCGYVLQRQLAASGIDCVVVAPSLIPVKPGSQIKTDRRDARKLAELHRAGLLTEVHPPSEDEEAVRDLGRCRADARLDLTRARNRLSKFLLRRGRVYRVERRPTWSAKYRVWLHGLAFERPADQVVFEDYLLTVEQVEARLEALDEQIEILSTHDPYRVPVAALRCFHGIDTVTAMALAAELHQPRRFPGARQLMAYPSAWCPARPVAATVVAKEGSPEPAIATSAACWSRRRGITDTNPSLGGPCASGGAVSRPPSSPSPIVPYDALPCATGA